MRKYKRLVGAIIEIANLYNGKTIQLLTEPNEENKFNVEILYYTQDIVAILEKYDIEVISIHSKDNSPYLLAEMFLTGVICEEDISPIPPTDLRIREVAKKNHYSELQQEFFISGATWMRKMLIGR